MKNPVLTVTVLALLSFLTIPVPAAIALSPSQIPDGRTPPTTYSDSAICLPDHPADLQFVSRWESTSFDAIFATLKITTKARSNNVISAPGIGTDLLSAMVDGYEELARIVEEKGTISLPDTGISGEVEGSFEGMESVTSAEFGSIMVKGENSISRMVSDSDTTTRIENFYSLYLTSDTVAIDRLTQNYEDSEQERYETIVSYRGMKPFDRQVVIQKLISNITDGGGHVSVIGLRKKEIIEYFVSLSFPFNGQ